MKQEMKQEKGYNTELWQEIVTMGKKADPAKKSQVNTFDDDDLNTILGTMDFFGASDIWMKQTYMDLSSKTAFAPRFRLFDWLAMCVMSRNDDDRLTNNVGLKVLVYAFLKVKGDPTEFIADLRATDYDLSRNNSWEKIKIDLGGN